MPQDSIQYREKRNEEKERKRPDASTGYDDIFQFRITDLLNTGDHVEEVAKRNGIGDRDTLPMETFEKF